MSLPAALGNDAEGVSPNKGTAHRSNISSNVYGTKRWQIVIYYNPDLYVVMAKRALPNGPWTSFVYNGTNGLPTLQLAAYDDSHKNTSCAIDSDGYVHMQWDGNRVWDDVNLKYRRSTVTIDQWQGQLTNNLAMTGYAGEGNLNYPTFFFDPVGNLYFTYRDGVASSADQILNRYDTATETWSGVGATNGRIINGKTNDSVYMNIVPMFSDDWDGAGTGRMWVVWTWRYSEDVTDYFDIMAMYWTGVGTTWKKPNGTAQTIPATVANATAIHEADDREQGKWIQTSSRDFACSADGTKIMVTFLEREFDGPNVVQTNRILLVDNGVVTLGTYEGAQCRTVWDQVDEKFKYFEGDNGTISFLEQTTGVGRTAKTAIGNFYGNGATSTSYSPFFWDRNLLKQTGRLQALRIPSQQLSVTPDVVEIGSLVKKDLPPMDFGGNTFTPTLRYNNGAATLLTFRPR